MFEGWVEDLFICGLEGQMTLGYTWEREASDTTRLRVAES